MQDWLGNQHTLDTSGWMGHDKDSLQPTTTTKSLAPDHILNSVFATAQLLASKSVDARELALSGLAYATVKVLAQTAPFLITTNMKMKNQMT